MPSIQESLGADLSGYKSASRLPALPLVLNGDRPKSNTNIRCPLPPFNADPDTLRQFENSAYQMPQVRVIPLPQITVAPPIRPVTTISVAASSGGGSGVPPTLSAKSTTFSTGLLAAGGNIQGTIALQKSFQLLSISASAACEVRLYGLGAMQAFDNARLEGSPVPAEVTSNIISCVTFDTLPFSWSWQNRIASNQDTPQTATAYITVYNNTDSDVANIAVTISYLPLES